MSSAPSESPSGHSRGTNSSISSDKQALDPIFRNALRYTVSANEYELLHKYLLSRAPAAVKKRTLPPKKFEKLTGNEYNIASVRAALRVFAAIYVGSKGYDFVTRQFLAKRKGASVVAARPPTSKNPNARLAASASLILLFHRLLYRFFSRLRTSLLESSAEPFRSRNPRIARALTSSFTPAAGASLAGAFLGLTPSSPLRTTIAIYALTRSLEYSYNALESARIIFPSGQPSWFGSWLLMPLCYGQLLHAFVFDRDCFPAGFGDFILRRSPEYIHARPSQHPQSRPYPATYDVVDALASLSRLHWPPFRSPILFPSTQPTLTSTPLALVRPLTDPAHPLIQHTSCAILHPRDPSCSLVHLKFWLRSFPTNFRLFTLIYTALSLLSLRRLLNHPSEAVRSILRRALRMAIFVTGAIGSAWASICLFSALLPRNFLPSARFFLGGMLGGSWAYVARRGQRGNFLYCTRLSIDSAWKVGRKRGWWRAVPGGDVALFVAAMGAMGVVYQKRPAAVTSGVLRKSISWSRGEGWEDKGRAESTGQEKEKGE